jgi:hypothetical protein
MSELLESDPSTLTAGSLNVINGDLGLHGGVYPQRRSGGPVAARARACPEEAHLSPLLPAT